MNTVSVPLISDTALYAKLATELGISESQVTSFIALYDEGASVPFIARYRKDKTGGLDDDVLRQLEKRLITLRDLAERRAKIYEQLASQNVLTEALAYRLNEADSKLALEEIYAPYRPRRKSLAVKASLAGLDSVADAILAGVPITQALAGYESVTSVTDSAGEQFAVDYSTEALQLEGVSAIIMDKWATALTLLDELRISFNQTAMLQSALISEDKREAGEKFSQYFAHSEPFAKLSGHRLLAMLRGRQQNILALKVAGEDDTALAKIYRYFAVDENPNSTFLRTVADKLWAQKWRGQLEHRLLTEHRLQAEQAAIQIFADNLGHLLMSAPAGRQVILGVDPGFRHGVKMAVIDDVGDVLATATVYPFTDSSQDKAKAVIAQLIDTHKVTLIALGNGTASRETETLLKSLVKEHKLGVQIVMISEAGASVYSASELASHELPDLDVSLRGAVSIARRLQDPLSELVKTPPHAIGVGQYQHDVNQSELTDTLGKVTEDCVNKVGVDVNTASPSILSYIAGLNKNVAEQIVAYRRDHGAFTNRNDLKNVPRLGNKTFEQAAGFLRIKSSDEPLDGTGVHPESYTLIYDLLAKHDIAVHEAIGNRALADKLLTDVAPLSPASLAINELTKARHDPRGEFRTASFMEGVNSVADLTEGMVLEGVVTNVTAFGCFVDIGVHQDGLVHISELKDGFVASPSDVVKPFDIVKVRVLEVDDKRGRIALSMKTQTAPAKDDRPRRPSKPKAVATPKPSKPTTKATPPKLGSLGALLQQAGLK